MRIVVGRPISLGAYRVSLTARLFSEFPHHFTRIRASILAICADLADQRITKVF